MTPTKKHRPPDSTFGAIGLTRPTPKRRDHNKRRALIVRRLAAMKQNGERR